MNRNYFLRKTEIDYIYKTSHDHVLKNAINDQDYGYGGRDDWEMKKLGDVLSSKTMLAQLVIPELMLQSVATPRELLENPFQLYLDMLNNKLPLPIGASPYWGLLSGLKSGYLKPRKENMCALVELPFDPSQHSFKDLCEQMKNRNGLIMFNDNFYYLDVNKGTLRKLDLNCSTTDLSKLKKLFIHKYAMADHEEINFINELTGLNLKVSECFHSYFQVDAGVNREFRTGVGLFSVRDWILECPVATSLAKKNSKVTYKLTNGDTHIHYAGKGGERQIFVDKLLLPYLYIDLKKIIQQSDTPEKGYDKFDVQVIPGQKYELISSQKATDILKPNEVVLGDESGEQSTIKIK